MRLSHWTWEPLEQVVSREQEPATLHGKPQGLWVSVDGEDDWAAWCEAESFRDTGAQLRYEVLLAPDADVLVLDTADAVLDFTREYSVGIWEELDWHRRLEGIAWDRVAAAHQGLVIAPYQWSLRLRPEATWYYTWDCASGCIWDAAAIKEWRPWREPDVVRRRTTSRSGRGAR